MKVLLVRPRPDPETIGLQHIMVVEPLELEILAALCSPEAEPVVVDMLLERDSFGDILAREDPDVVAVTGYITNVPAMIDCCREAKRRDAHIATVVGGVHCEVRPEDLDDPAVDFRVVRNAVTGFPGLLAHLRGERELPGGILAAGQVIEANALPAQDFAYVRPDRASTARYRHAYFYVFKDRVALLKTAFGCPFRCTFCFCRRITEGLYRERDIEDVLDELAGIREDEVYIVDDDFLLSPRRLRRFIEGVKRRGIRKRYLVYGRADFIARHPALIESLRDVGLRTVIVGFETFVEGELGRFRKQTTVRINEQAMGVLNRAGVECFATMILSPEWGREEFDLTAAALRRLGIRYVNLQPLTPLPGTQLPVSPGELLVPYGDYPRWDLAHVMLRPRKLSVAGYYREILRLYVRTLYRFRYLAGHLWHSPSMLARIIVGANRVKRQYEARIEEEERCRSCS